MQDVPTVIATVGGEGTRLFPLTLKQPKPLVSLCGRAIVDRIFETLATQGCREFILASKGAENTNRLKEYFKEGRGFSDRLKLHPKAIFRYQPNYDDAGNADAVRFCMEYYNIKGDILVVSGDNVIDIDLRNLMEYHRKKKSLLTVGIKELGDGEDISQYGVAELRDESRIKRFVEKPKPAEAPSRLINTSIYVFSPEIRKVFQEMGGEVRDIGQNVIPYLTERGYPVYGYEVEGYWADIGTPGSFLKTSQDILHGKLSRIKFKQQTTLLKLIGLARAEEKKQIGEHVSIGADCRIGNNARIESSFIGDNCVIGEGAKIIGSVVMDFVNVERNVYLNKCIVARYAT
ncbi:MAG: NDP-sugar synthase, partial [Candidatus Hydrothermarchaeota archaeon]|nr:NDP-sugar synthase [Candidatus Hydrothermarchaeota archaeon]